MLVVTPTISIPLREFEFSYARSSGPGGQNVNKVNTKVTLHWNVRDSESLPEAMAERFCEKYARRINKEGQVVITSQRFRDQGRNVADCLSKLRDLLLEVEATPKRRRQRTRPTAAAQRRRLEDKRRQSEKKARRKGFD